MVEVQNGVWKHTSDASDDHKDVFGEVGRWGKKYKTKCESTPESCGDPTDVLVGGVRNKTESKITPDVPDPRWGGGMMRYKTRVRKHT